MCSLFHVSRWLADPISSKPPLPEITRRGQRQTMPTPGLDNHDAQQEKNNEKRRKTTKHASGTQLQSFCLPQPPPGSDRLPPTQWPLNLTYPDYYGCQALCPTYILRLDQTCGMTSSSQWQPRCRRKTSPVSFLLTRTRRTWVQAIAALPLSTPGTATALIPSEDGSENKRPWNDELGPDQEDQEEDIHRNAQSSLDVTMYEVDVQRKKRKCRAP
ncbi:hypothetical protein FB451DRAFT_294423 [Mycena latifolia]|nr:hypothetical protein FB451DRAFT_294423 [Mycena latifolia]